MNCPNCNEQISERGIFCRACAAQVRCLKCRELLEPAAKACVECGTKIGQHVDSVDGNSVSTATPAPNRNTLSYREDRNSRHFEASLTDSVMNGLGDVFAELFAQRGVGRNVIHSNARAVPKEKVILDSSRQLTEQPAPPPEVQIHEATQERPVPIPYDRDRVLKIFAINGEEMELTDNRLKAKTCADYQRRLTYLYLYAKELHGNPSTPRQDLTKILKDAKVLDSNARAWLAKKVGFGVDTEDRLKLNAGSREQAVKFLNEILDPNIADDWNPDTRTIKPRAKKAS